MHWCCIVKLTYVLLRTDDSFFSVVVVQVFEFIHGLSLLRLIIRSQTAQFMRLCEVEEDHEE